MTTPIRVLIAEDQPVFRAALVDVVEEQAGLELVGTARDADEAIRLVRRHRPDVALLDVKMPEGGGPRAAREIRTSSPKTRVVALSAYDDRKSVLDMLRAGAAGYLLKDASGDQVARAIEFTTRGEAVLSRRVTAEVIEELVDLLDRSEQFAEELRDLDRTKSELIQVLSHELRTPLTVINGAALSLAKAGGRGTPEQLAELSASVGRATARLERLASNVSIAAGLDSRGVSAKTRPTAVEVLLTRAANEFQHMGDRLRFLSDFSETDPQMAADLDLAVRALVLVIENALALSPEEQVVEVGSEVQDREIEIHVSDRGPGIPEALKEQVFQPFVQADSSETRSHQGLGIGLYLARRIMEAHGGRIEVVPRAGGGSTFVLSFPSVRSFGRGGR